MDKHHKNAAKQSRDGKARYVVYVPDCGTDVFSAEQVAIYGSLIFIEAVYLGGVQIATREAA